MVDTLGLLLAIVVHSAGIQDRDGAKLVLLQALAKWSRLQWIWADGAYGGPLVQWVSQVCGWVLSIVKRPEGQKGWVLLPHRWVVERTFGWLNWCRRLSKDYEYLPESAEVMIYIAMIRLMVRRLA